MTEIEQKALALQNEVRSERKLTPYVAVDRVGNTDDEALCRAIEAHEAFKREVSDAVIEEFGESYSMVPKAFHRFILPKPVDPLVALANELHVHRLSLEQALTKLGVELSPIGENVA